MKKLVMFGLALVVALATGPVFAGNQTDTTGAKDAGGKCSAKKCCAKKCAGEKSSCTRKSDSERCARADAKKAKSGCCAKAAKQGSKCSSKCSKRNAKEAPAADSETPATGESKVS